MADTQRRITLVKKIKADGSPCRKCADVLARLEQGGWMGAIDHVAVADERDPASEGMQLAARFGVDAAPFFVVETGAAPPQIYTSYIRFLKDVLEAQPSESEEIADLQDANPDLDFL